MAAAPSVCTLRSPAQWPEQGAAAWPSAQPATRVLFLVSAHNSLSQRAYVELTDMGHEVSVAVVDSGAAMAAAVLRHQPELIVCPMLKTFIPQAIWEQHRCLVMHPGPVGDRGPSSLDWAIELGAEQWGVTVLEANGEFDGGDVWATRSFPTRAVGKSSLYRHEVRRAAIEAIVEAVGKVVGGGEPQPLNPRDPRVTGRARPLMKQDHRAIDWSSDSTDTVICKIRAAEGHPGVLDTVEGTAFHLFGVHRERALYGEAGEIVAQRNGAICRATIDGAVWITHLKQATAPGDRTSFKLPATHALELAGHALAVAEVAVPLHAPLRHDHTYREIAYEEEGGVGYLHFDFYNGAMSTEQCRRLRAAYLYARSRRRTKVIVLMGGSDFFSNGIHLNVIEAAIDPGAESWRNLRAIDDIVHDIVVTDSHLVISALGGDAAAGGVAFALAADEVLARDDVVLNPYYQHMGGLYGSEYWTYLLPQRVGARMSAELTTAPFEPVGTRRAIEIGLIDDACGATLSEFQALTRERARALASDPELAGMLDEKRRRRALDELAKPLQAYRSEEMARSRLSFFGPDSSYHNARWRFVHKLGGACEATAVPAGRRR